MHSDSNQNSNNQAQYLQPSNDSTYETVHM